MEPNKNMNGGPAQNTQNAYHVDDESPRQILTTANFWEENKLEADFMSIVLSPKDDIYHNDVLSPQMISKKIRRKNES